MAVIEGMSYRRRRRYSQGSSRLQRSSDEQDPDHSWNAIPFATTLGQGYR